MKRVIISIISFIVSFVVAFVIIISVSAYKDLKIEDALKTEIQEINTYLQQDVIDYDRINILLERTISNGEYRLVELATKIYLKDYIKAYKSIETIMNSEEMQNLLTPINYKEDGPKFVKSQAFVEKSHQDLIIYRDRFLYFYEEDKIMSYLNCDDEYYIDFYQNEIFGNLRDVKEAENEINKGIYFLEVASKIFDLLSKNKEKWKIEDNRIYLDDDILNEYNNLIKSITNQNDNNLNQI